MTLHRIVFNLRSGIAALGVASTALPATADTFNCPAAFPPQAMQFSPTTDGWIGAPGDAAPLYSAEVFDGPPEQRASLQPGASSRNTSSWTFEGSYPQGIWLQCSYAGGALMLSRRLPKVPAVCIANYPKMSKGRPVSVLFDCH